jgi:hypothetical protein
VGRGIKVDVRGENAEVVQIVCSTAVVSVGVLEFSEVVECRYLIERQLDGTRMNIVWSLPTVGYARCNFPSDTVSSDSCPV